MVLGIAINTVNKNTNYLVSIIISYYYSKSKKGSKLL